MSLNFLARGVLGKLARIARRMLPFARSPQVIPLTFADIERRRQQAHGADARHTACCCSECRHVRTVARAGQVEV